MTDEKKTEDTHTLTNQQLKQIFSLGNSVLSARSDAARKLGLSFNGLRDTYQVCGYKETLQFTDFWNSYQRGDIAHRICSAYPDATWKGTPILTDDEDPKKETELEKEWKALAKRLNIYSYFSRADTLAQIGRYSVLMLGFNDNNKLDIEVNGATELLYVQPYSEKNAKVSSFDANTKSPRFGLPLLYEVNTGASAANEAGSSSIETKTIKVHWSRIIHIADGLLENDVYGTPVLEAVYNRLFDLEKVSAGVGEAFWQAVYGGIAFEADKEVDLSQSADALEDEMEAFVHGFQRYLRLQGVQAKPLTPKIGNPQYPSELYFKLIAGTTGIPVRILTGSERGELASSQDESNWLSRVNERRGDFAEPHIIKATIERLIEVGILPAPSNEEWHVVWPELKTEDRKETAEVADSTMKALKAYLDAGGEAIMTPLVFLTDILGFAQERAEAVIKEAEGMLEEENEDNEEIDRQMEDDEDDDSGEED